MATKQGILWVNDNDTWVRADDLHPFGKGPVEARVEAFNNLSLWSSISGTWTHPAGRTGTCVQQTSSGNATYLFPAAYQQSTVIVGFAYRVNSLSASQLLCTLRSDTGATSHVSLLVNISGAIEVRRGTSGGTLLGATPAGVVPLNTWVYVEVQATLSDTNGLVAIRVNGTQQLRLAGIDTKNAGTKTVFDALLLAGLAGGVTNQWDDMYIIAGTDEMFQGSIAVTATGTMPVWKDPLQVYGKLGADWYAAWPIKVPVEYPAPTNLRVTALTSTSATVAWDAITDPSPIRYRVQWGGGTLLDTNYDVGTNLTHSLSGLTPATTYDVTVWGDFPEGFGLSATITLTTGASTPPSITSWTPRTYNILDMVIAGTAPFELFCSVGARAGQTIPIASAGATAIGGLSGKEYWYLRNAGGSTARFWTDDGTPAQSGTTGAVRTSLANPLPSGFGRGSCAGIDWGCPAMSAHGSFPYSNTNDGTGATRWQTGNYPRGWVQHTIGIPTNYRVRRFMFVQGDGAGNTEMVTPVYSVDSGATFKRWSHFGNAWVPATDATINPGTTSPNGLLSIDSAGNWARDWNWQLTSAATFASPFIPENATNLSQRWIYVRWGLVHQTGSFGANMGECWIEYQEPSTPATAEVKCTRGWG